MTDQQRITAHGGRISNGHGKWGSGFPARRWVLLIAAAIAAGLSTAGQAQTLINVDFGAGAVSGKIGFAATGQQTNDFWNRYRHYEPKFVPGMALVPNGRLEQLKYADGSGSAVALSVSNAPGVWGNATGDPMFDSYLFAPNGSNLVMTVSGLESGRYHFYLYGHADADVAGEQNSLFSLRAGTNRFGPSGAAGVAGWQAGQPWRDRGNYLVFRDVSITSGEAVTIEVEPGAGGIAVLNGMQILSRGTAPPRLEFPVAPIAKGSLTNLLLREVKYRGRLSPEGARFEVTVDAESQSTNELTVLLFRGDMALLDPKLPPGWRVINEGNAFYLIAAAPGAHRLEFGIAAKVRRQEPWNEISFTGPSAAIATVEAEATVADSEIQLRSGSALASDAGRSTIRGVLGADRQLALRWQTRTAEVQRTAVVAVESRVVGHITPTTVRYDCEFKYEIMQATVSALNLVLPADQSITKLEGELVRDWHLAAREDKQFLTVEFIRPVENFVTLKLTTEQVLPALPALITLSPPGPVEVQRETGLFRLATEDVTARIDAAPGMRQVNAAENETAAFRFNSRPALARVELTPLEPALTVAARINAWLEENRLLVRHELDLQIVKAGVYHVDLTPQPGFSVADVRGSGVEEWKVGAGGLRITFGQRVLGTRKLVVQLERGLSNTPPQIVILPLTVKGAERESAMIGVGSVAGLELKTTSAAGVREIPVAALAEPKEALLAFRADQGTWAITFSAARLNPRLLGEVFNLMTVGDGIVGGSATVRFAILNQGVQQLRVRVPAHWRNLEFTGANLRRKDKQDDIWTISLQDKAWDGYTLVVTYDFAFDPRQASVNAAGAHLPDVERENGSLAITTAGGLVIQPGTATEPLRLIDPTELAATDRALITRPVLLAYRYEGTNYTLGLNVTRNSEVPLLDAVADRAQLTSVLTESGEMLTQASFMVKNSERQFQRFQLPDGATLWGATVNGEPVKVDQDGKWLLVSLPRGADRDQVFAVDLKYAQRLGTLSHWYPRRIDLAAPQTDVPGTYAEWEVYAPPSRHVSGFGGNMTVATGTTYGWREAWERFLRVYRGFWHQHNVFFVFSAVALVFLVAAVNWGRRRGVRGVLSAIVLLCGLAILASMMMPAMSKAKSKALRLTSLNNLKQIGAAARVYAAQNEGNLPQGIDEIMDRLGSRSVLVDPQTGERFTYVGAGKNEADPNALLAFSAEKDGRRKVALTDGTVHEVDARGFEALLGGNAADRQLAVSGSVPPATQPSKPDATPEHLFGSTPLPRAPQSRLSRAAEVPLAAVLPAPGQAGAGGGGGLGAPASSLALPSVAGIRSLKIEIPRAGKMFQFTRVLNLGGEPPKVRLSIMSAKAVAGLRMGFEILAFGLGSVLIWREWRRERPRSLWLSVGAVLTIISLGDLLIAWRALHLALIVAVPGALLLLALLFVWRRWSGRRRSADTSPLDASPAAINPIPPATAILLISLAGIFGDPAPARADDAARVVSPPVSIVSARYSGVAQDQIAQFEGTFELLANGTNATIWLFGKDVAVHEFVSLTNDVRLWREGERVGMLLPRSGAAAARVKFVVRVTDESGKRKLDFGLPAALASSLVLTVDEPEAEIEFPAAVTLERKVEEKRTRIDAVIGGAHRAVITWTPRLKRASEIAATAFVQETALATFSGLTLSLRSVLEYQVTQGELRQLRVSVPPGQKVLRVRGELVRFWNVAATNQAELIIDLIKGTSATVRVVIDSEAAVDPLPATLSLALPVPLGVKRTAGAVAMRAAEELGITVERAEGLERMDVAEFARRYGEELTQVTSAWQFRKPEFGLAVKVEMLQPRLEVLVHNHFVIGPDQINLQARLEYEIKRAGVFSLSVLCPSTGRVDTVKSEALQGWTVRTEGTNRLIEIALKQRVMGKVSVEVTLTETVTNLPPVLELAGVQPWRADDVVGYVSVASEPGVAAKSSSFAGVAEVPVSILPAGVRPAAGWLAYKQTARTPGTPWTLRVAVESVESWVRAETVSLFTASETLMTGRALIRYDIQNAPVKEFRLKIPGTWRNVEVLGPGIRQRDKTNDQWRIELQNKVRGEYTLTVQWEQSVASGSNALEVAAVESLGVERETGFVLVRARAPLQVSPVRTGGDMQRIDERELPAWAASLSGSKPGNGGLTYKYVRTGWQLAVRVERFSEASVLQALVESARFRTVVADDGQTITQMDLQVRNNGRQHLQVQLPEGARVWSAFVAGQPVRPGARGGSYFLPLEGIGTDEPALIELVYVAEGRFPQRRGKLQFTSPRLDVPIKDARWELFLPPDYDYKNFGGSMTYQWAELSTAVAQDFTVAEYSRQEAAQHAELAAQAADLLRKARNDLDAGNFKDSGNKLSFFRSRVLRDESSTLELKKLEQDLNRAQGSNLLLAQQELVLENAERLGELSLGLEAARQKRTGAYDDKVAEQQVVQLQKAQAVAAIHTAPLRVNLPTRGLRHTFTQVLQTEVNQPLNITLSAINQHQMGWVKMLALGGVAFLVLWCGMTWLAMAKTQAAR